MARLTGVTVRTLHHYDAIGLLKPKKTTQAGYRLYDGESLATLQQILFFRELAFPLEEIRQIMTNPRYDPLEALKQHRELLLQKRDRLDGLIALAERRMKGENILNFQEFDTSALKTAREHYAAEVKARWGHTPAYQEEANRTEAYTDHQWSALSGEGAALLRQFGLLQHLSPGSQEVQALVKAWQTYITAHFYHCTKDILSGLGQMYRADPRFTQYIDRYGEGTAAFLADAIAIYCCAQ